MAEPKFTISQQRAESKRKADEDIPPERPAKLRATARSGDRRKEPQILNGQSTEALFMARHAAEFDNHSVGKELTHPAGSFEDFPRMSQTTCETPDWQPCLVRLAAQKQGVYTCVFDVNNPDKQTSLPLTEDHVRAACLRAQMPGFKEVWQESFHVFLASFQGFANADKARRRKRLLHFAAPYSPNAPFEKLSVSAKPHWHEVNRVFIYDINTKPVNHYTVARHVFKALEGPMASCFRLYKQDYREHNGRQKRIRYLLRQCKHMSLIPVERLYIPLNAPLGEQNVWDIFKAVYRNWTCPACNKRCHSGDVSTCESAVDLLRVHEGALR